MRYSNFRIDNAGTEKFPDMVIITKGPSKYKDLIGRRFVNITKAKVIIDSVTVIIRHSYKDEYIL